MIDDKDTGYLNNADDFLFGFGKAEPVKKYVFGDLIVEKEDNNDEGSHFRISEKMNESNESFGNAVLQNNEYSDYYEGNDDKDEIYYQTQDGLVSASILREEFSKVKAKRRSFKIEYINSVSRRRITFAKRRKGLLKKAEELSILTGCEVLCIVMDKSGEVSWYRSQKMQNLSKICQDELVRLRKNESREFRK